MTLTLGDWYFKGDLPDMSGIVLGRRVEVIVGDLFKLSLPVSKICGYCFVAEDAYTKVFVDMTTGSCEILKDLKRPGIAGARLTVERERDKVRCSL